MQQDVASSGGFWSGPTPWWATVAIALLTGLLTVAITLANNRAASRRDAAKLRADDRRSDRRTAASVQVASDRFGLAMRWYYGRWLASTQAEGAEAEEMAEVAAAAREKAQESVGGLQEALRAASLTLTSDEVIASGERLEVEALEILRKINLYEQGLAFRIHSPGSIDLLFAGFDEELAQYMAEARRTLRDS